MGHEMIRLRWFLVPVVLAAAGCGNNSDTAPKQTLNEVEQKQVKELQEQRQKEWSGTKGH
jgi:hypothetical protein